MDKKSDSIDGIAVIGLSFSFPGAKNEYELWNNLKNGVESITFFSDDEIKADGVDYWLLKNPSYVKARGVIDGIENFDASFFNYSDEEAELIDPQQRLLLTHAWKALESAGYAPDKITFPVGVYAGTGMNTYFLNNIIRGKDSFDFLESILSFRQMIGNDKDFVAARVSYKLNLHGPSVNVQSACSTSLLAVHQACQSLLDRECDMAIAGGVSILVPQKQGYLHQDGMILSPDGHCRAFDAKAGGTVPGNGVGVVVLKRLDDALKDNDNIRAVIRGTATNNDGSDKLSFTAPSIEKQAEVIANALAFSGVSPETISYIESHGTGTDLGDTVEIDALTKAFRTGTNKKNFCYIGSFKSNIGHLFVAAGVAGLIKAILSLNQRMIPPSLHLNKPNPKINFSDSPFILADKLIPWEKGDFPRRAGVSSFGMGGVNVHLILEEWPSQESFNPIGWQIPFMPYCLTLSAKSDWSLAQYARDFLDLITEKKDICLRDLCFTASQKPHFSHRLSVVFTTCEDLSIGLKKFLKKEECESLFSGTIPKEHKPQLAVICTCRFKENFDHRAFYDKFSDYRKIVDDCCEILKENSGIDVLRYFNKEDDEKNYDKLSKESQNVRRSICNFVSSLAFAGLYKHLEIMPSHFIGYGIGEVAALFYSGAIGLKTAMEIMLFVHCNTGARSYANPDGDLFNKLQAVRTYLENSEVEIISSLTEKNILESLIDPKNWLLSLEEFKTDSSNLNFFKPHSIADGSDDQTYKANDSCCFLSIGTCKEADCNDLADSWDPKLMFIYNIAALYANGFLINWNALYKNNDPLPHRISLPTYPFEPHRHWIDISDKSEKIIAEEASLKSAENLIYQNVWKRIPFRLKNPLERVRLASGKYWVIFSDIGGSAEKLAKILLRLKQIPILIYKSNPYNNKFWHSFTFDIYNEQDWQDLAKKILHISNEDIFRVIFLRSLDLLSPGLLNPGLPVSNPLDANNLKFVQNDYFRCIRGILRHIIPEKRQGGVKEPKLWIVTRDALFVDSKDTLKGLAGSLLFGLSRVLELESSFLGGVIDLPGQACADEEEMVLAEIADSRDERSIAIRSGECHVLRLVRDSEKSLQNGIQAKSFSFDGTYLVTGGSGYLGQHVIKWLIRKGAKSIAVLSRSGNFYNFNKDLREYINTTNSDVVFINGDVANLSDVNKCMEKIRHLPPLKGIIHAAGTLEKKNFIDTTLSETSSPIKAKVFGALNLHKLTLDMPLDFFVCFSSISSVMGSLKFSFYASANSFLDNFAQYRNAKGLYTSSINWGPWEGGGLATEETIENLRGLGILGLRPDTCLDILESVIKNKLVRAFVADFDMPRFRRTYCSIYHQLFFEELNHMQGNNLILKQDKEQDRDDFIFNGRSLIDLLEKRGGSDDISDSEGVIDNAKTLDELGFDSLSKIELFDFLKRKTNVNMSFADFQMINSIADIREVWEKNGL